MNPRLHPSEDVRRFAYSSDDFLYRDHLGRRVVADVEGSGFVFVETADCLLSAICDDFPATGFPAMYERYCVVIADGPGAAVVTAKLGTSECLSQSGVDVSLPYSGSGWLISAEVPVVRDGRELIGPFAISVPVPFFLDLKGQGSARIAPSSTTATLIDTWEIEDADALKARSFKVQNISKVTTLASPLPDGSMHSGPVASHLNRASWKVELPTDVEGLLLRKLYDRFHGRQRARVLIDGTMAGWWYEPVQDRTNRWAFATFGVPGEFLSGKTYVEISIDPPSGTPLWSVSRMEVYVLRSSG